MPTTAAVPSRRSLTRMSLTDIRRELARRQRYVATLERRKERLLQRVASLDQQIRANGGANGALRMGKRTRAHNDVSLIDALAETLKGKTLSVTAAAEAVQKDGYRTTSPNFRTMVNAALLNKRKFKRVSRGQYTAT